MIPGHNPPVVLSSYASGHDCLDIPCAITHNRPIVRGRRDRKVAARGLFFSGRARSATFEPLPLVSSADAPFRPLTTLALFACALAAPAAPARLAVVANGKTQVKVVDLGRKKVVARPDVGLPARAVALSLDGLRAYVVASGSTAGRLAAIDLVSRTVVASIPVPPGARGVAIAPDGSRAYVTSGGRQGKVTVVDLVTGAPVAEIATSKRPAAIALSPDGSRAYVISGKRKLALVDVVGMRNVRIHQGRDRPVLPGGRPLRRARVRHERRQPSRVDHRRGAVQVRRRRSESAGRSAGSHCHPTGSVPWSARAAVAQGGRDQPPPREADPAHLGR